MRDETRAAPGRVGPAKDADVLFLPAAGRPPARATVTALLQVRLDSWTGAADFVADLLEIACVREAMVLAGELDLAVLVDCTDLTELDLTVRGVRSLGALEIETRIVLCAVPGPAAATRVPRAGAF